MERIAITGAAGNVGTQARRALAEYDLRPITHQERPDLDSVVLDLRDREDLRAAFSGCSAVVHMAGQPSPKAAWMDVVENNITGTRNVLEAAVETDVDRVVFGSSNHVQHMYNVDDTSEPGTTRRQPITVDHDDPVRPTSYYGVSKIAGEALGSYYADRCGLEVVNQRIGWLLTEQQLREKQSEQPARARHARTMWLSPRDCRHAIRRSIEASLPENPLTVNVLSRNRDRYFNLTHTLRSLGYTPRDDSWEALAEGDRDDWT